MRGRKKKSNRIYFIIAGALVLVIGIIVLIVLSGRSTGPSVSSPIGQVNAAGDHVAMRDGIITTGETGMRYIGQDNAVRWQLEGTGSRVKASGRIAMLSGEKNVLVADVNGKKLFEKDYERKILLTGCGNSLVLVAYQGDDATVLEVLDAAGKQVYTASFKGETLMDAGFYGNDDTLWTLAVNTGGSMTVSQITLYNPKTQRVTGLIRIEEQVVYKILFFSDRLYAIGTGHLLCYNYTGNKISEIPIYGWVLQDALATASGAHFILSPADEENFGVVRIIAPSGERVVSIAETAHKAAFLGEMPVAFHQDKMLDCRQETAVIALNLGFSPLRIKPLGEGKILAGDDKQVVVIQAR